MPYNKNNIGRPPREEYINRCIEEYKSHPDDFDLESDLVKSLSGALTGLVQDNNLIAYRCTLRAAAAAELLSEPNQ